MNRRDMITRLLALCAASGPIRGFAQMRKDEKPYRIALLPDFASRSAPLLKLFIETLRDAGRIEGRDFVLFRSGVTYGNPDVGLAVKRVVEGNPDLIFAVNTGYVVMAQRLTSSIPIVMWASGFPVEAGVADSLARPGRNVTGMAGYSGTGLLGKDLQLLREAKPSIKRVGVLWDYVPPFNPREEIDPCYQEIRDAARRLKLDASILEIARPEQVDAALATVGTEHRQALILTSGVALATHRQKILEYAIQNRLPTLTDYQWAGIEPQPLLSYGPSISVMIRQATGYVDRILWGSAKPGDLPIQQPAKYELVVNVKTAKAIRLSLPQSLLVLADQLVE